jgi:hypothetical protein
MKFGWGRKLLSQLTCIAPSIRSHIVVHPKCSAERQMLSVGQALPGLVQSYSVHSSFIFSIDNFSKHQPKASNLFYFTTTRSSIFIIMATDSDASRIAETETCRGCTTFSSYMSDTIPFLTLIPAPDTPALCMARSSVTT